MEKMNVNGLDIAYTRTGKGSPLVLIHGYPLDHTIWDKVIPLLKGKFDVIAPDLRGFGESMSTTREYGMKEYAADIAGLLDGLNLPQAAIVGHSMGGYVALAFTKAFPARVRSLGLVSSQARADPPDRQEARLKSAEDVAQNGVGGVADGMSPKLSADASLQTYARDLINRQSPAGIIGALKAMAYREDSMEMLRTSQIPLVLVHGDADALIPIDRSREIESAVLQARMFTLAGASHLPMLENPGKTAEALEHLA